jgi:hypothetical protein
MTSLSQHSTTYQRSHSCALPTVRQHLHPLSQPVKMSNALCSRGQRHRGSRYQYFKINMINIIIIKMSNALISGGPGHRGSRYKFFSVRVCVWSVCGLCLSAGGAICKVGPSIAAGGAICKVGPSIDDTSVFMCVCLCLSVCVCVPQLAGP